MPTPSQAQQLILDEESCERRRIQYAIESGAVQREQIDRRHLKAELAAIANHAAGVLPTIVALSEHERRRYSVAKALNDQARGSKELTLEKEISVSIGHDLKTVPEHGGILVPLKLSAGGLDTKTNVAGGYITQTNVVKDILDHLRAHTRVLQLGARFLSGLRFNQSFPVENAMHAASWVGENPGVDVPASDPSFTVRNANAKSLTSTTSASRQVLGQASPNIENWIRERIALAHGTALDLAAINGSGTSNQPLGLLRATGIGDVAIGTNGGAPTLAAVLAMETALGDANSDSESCAWLTTSKMRGKLRALLEVSGGGLPLWRDGGTMLGYSAAVSNQVPSTLTKGSSSDCHALIFADWSQLLVAEFTGAVEITSDPYALKRQGMIELTSWALWDTLVLEPGAFVAIQDTRSV